MVEHTHIGVYGLVLNADRILLIKKGRGPYTGKYDLPGGKIEFGETQIEALKREIFEETGLECRNIELIDGISNRVQWKKENGEIEDLHHIGFIYKVGVEYKSYIKDTFDGHDSLGAEWICIKSIDKDILSPFAYKVISNYKK
jgi:ADP-ribose pyrophosphatase YjhB (NUDIX family)